MTDEPVVESLRTKAYWAWEEYIEAAMAAQRDPNDLRALARAVEKRERWKQAHREALPVVRPRGERT